MKKSFLSGIAISAIVLVIGATFFLFYIFADYEGYDGDNKDLYTEAIFSLIGNRGYFLDGEILDDPEIIVIEEDNYGRTMFSYVESNDISSYSYLIAQKSDPDYVYFYPDYNFISSEYDYWNNQDKEMFTDDEINELKLLNDWDLPLDESKMVHFEITTLKEKPETAIEEEVFENLLKSLSGKSGYLGDDSLYRYSEYFMTDDYGRTIYYVYGVGRDAEGTGVSPDSISQYFYAVVIFQPDGSYDVNDSIMGLTNFQEYQNELCTFKTLNNWNQSLD
ncbi:hypothetical protein RJI07_03970 [Mycoplasmatota bacterium WC30]